MARTSGEPSTVIHWLIAGTLFVALLMLGAWALGIWCTGIR